MRKNRSSELKRVELIRKSQEEIRLEAVTQTDVEGIGRGISFEHTEFRACVRLILHVRSHAVYVRTFAKRIGITGTYDITLDVDAVNGDFVACQNSVHAVSGFSIYITKTEHHSAAGQWRVARQTNAVAFDLDSIINFHAEQIVKD